MDYEASLKKIGENITRIRKDQKMSGVELSLRCDMHSSDLIHIEKGRTNVTIKTLTRIANELGVTIIDLVQ